MKALYTWVRRIARFGLILAIGVSMSAEAGWFGFGDTSWKEEVLLHDGSKIIVTRTVERGGRHEIGQEPPYKEQSLSFVMPETKQEVIWQDKFSEDLGSASFLPMLLDINQGIAYLVVSPMGCLSYNKWGRPNPPYVVFKYEKNEWSRISLHELPMKIKTPNLIFSDPNNVVKQLGKSLIPANTIQEIIAQYRQPEYKTILRKPFPTAAGGCEKLIYYKGAWVGPGDSIGKRMMDRKSK